MRTGVGELRERAGRLRARLVRCDLCPRDCQVNRLAGERGYCGVAADLPVAAALAHFGEEPPISGTRGAGTIFFGGCNLRCDYCQNIQISRLLIPVASRGAGSVADEMLRLEREGCHNIEWVTPSHLIPQILEAVALAAEQGLAVPIVYNTGGYDRVEILRELDGVVDVYLPDLKYGHAEAGGRLSGASDYWEIARHAVHEMVRQAGELQVDAAGCAQRGVIVRHLVLPGDLAGSGEVLRFIASLDPRPPLALMAQFSPIPQCGHPGLARPLSEAEYDRVRRQVEDLGLEGWIQDLSSAATFRPDFSRADPFSATGPAPR